MHSSAQVQKDHSPQQDNKSGKAPSPNMGQKSAEKVQVDKEEDEVQQHESDYEKDDEFEEEPEQKSSNKKLSKSNGDLSSSPAKKNLGMKAASSSKEFEDENEEEYSARVYNMEKSQEEIQAQGFLQNFFECPKNYQEVIF